MLFKKSLPNKEDKGQRIFAIYDLPLTEVKKWVSDVEKLSGQKLSYQNTNNIIEIFSSGDINKIKDALKQKIPELNAKIELFINNKYGLDFYKANYNEEMVDHFTNSTTLNKRQ